jgi:Tfp pilus assembly protein PilX
MRNYQKGQIMLIVVLIMVTVLTVGLSVAARSVTNTRTSQDSASSEKAFSAAEAGVEQSLTSNNNATGSFSNHSSYTTTVVNLSGPAFQLNSGSPILKDDSIDLWLSTYPGYTNQWGGSFTVYWGKTSDTCTQSEATNTMAALEVSVLTGTTANPHLTRYLFDPCGNRQAKNIFTSVIPASYGVAGGNYAYKSSLIVIGAGTGLVASITPLYASTQMAVQDSGGLPSQGTVIQSTGSSGGTQREIQTYRYYPKLPSEIFQYSLFVP